MKKMLGALLVLVVTGLPAVAMDFPDVGGTEYAIYRDKIIGQGWKPVANDIADSDGFPEVVCGSATCSADWTAPDGSQASLTLWPQCEGERVDGLISVCDSIQLVFPSAPEE